MALHAPRPSSNRSVDRTFVAPRSRWSRFTTALAALVGTAVVLTGGATAAHAEPSVAEIEAQIDRDWNKLEPVIEQVNAVRGQLAARRKQADALGRQIAPLQARVDAALGQVGGLAADAYKGDSLSTVNALLGSRSPGEGPYAGLDREPQDGGGPAAGGLDGLIQSFERSGLGDVIGSWIGHGPNREIAPNELEQAIGHDVLQTLSERTGLSREDLLSRLSRELPNAVDQYTPDGRMPQF